MQSKLFHGSLATRGFALAIALLLSPAACATPTDQQASDGKGLFLPEKIGRVPDDNDFDDPESDYCFDRMVQGPNVAIFWHKEYGEDPMANPNERRRFDVQKMLSECERFYDYYVDELEVVKKGDSISDDYKLLIFVFGGDEGTAYGGGIEGKVGALWTPAVRVNREPYGVLAHEMGHSFQFMSRVDAGTGAGGPIAEMSAQYLLWQVYPDWMTFENYHLVDFMKKTHFALFHATNMYHSPYVLEYWAGKHGKTFYGELNRQTRRGEDVVTTYKRMNDLTQEEFNDEMFDASRRFITWDLPRVEEVARRYANQHQCALQPAEDGWYRISPDRSPQDYGYNGIQLNVPDEGTTVELEFKGLTVAAGADSENAEKAGWRYGFVAYLKDDSRVYGDVYRDADGKATFEVPAETEHLWLVVMGAPTEHSPPVMRRGRRRPGQNVPEAEWPYQIKLTGTMLDESCVSIPKE
ncbi:DUF6055 domain-containing protein [Aeoliella sp. ICT_H6.2]|uniref:DUF6055 domain-containing protein n=1 Tax=Aeoliella straminimaris TaxID=2954799 RepID=A0A9X2JKG7_9BACT|nr:DUF6055 domain-containing protein [Aeoliella straminimaris]MCO6046484.1 DUF6055 domain-containing protein [Aeoliella straminimaris]